VIGNVARKIGRKDMNDTPREVSVPPQAILMRLLFGKQLTASLGALARLGVADHMSDDPQPVEDLAAKVGADAGSLYRVMRMLAAFDVFREEKGRRFALAPVGKVLQTDAPGSMRYTAMMLGDDWAIQAYAHIADSIRTGGDAFTAAFGKQVFEWFADHPEKAETFQRAMTNGSANAAQAILSAYEFSGIKRMADIGGGHGLLLASITLRCRACSSICRRSWPASHQAGLKNAVDGLASRPEVSSSTCRKAATLI
jgi:hypothetical protein